MLSTRLIRIQQQLFHVLHQRTRVGRKLVDVFQDKTQVGLDLVKLIDV